MPDGAEVNSLGGFRFPDATHRVAVLGRTGSGKSVFATWLLSHASYDRRPWLVIDHKDEELFTLLNRRIIQEIDPGDKLPKKPGLYIMHPTPKADDDAVSDTLADIWDRGNIGVYVDEGHALDARDPSFERLLFTGRSRHIPVICCSQRPVAVTPYLFSQADFFAVFPLRTYPDVKRCEDLIHTGVTAPLPQYHCRWHDVGRDRTMVLSPVDDPETIVERINRRAPQPFWW